MIIDSPHSLGSLPVSLSVSTFLSPAPAPAILLQTLCGAGRLSLLHGSGELNGAVEEQTIGAEAAEHGQPAHGFQHIPPTSSTAMNQQRVTIMN